MYKFLSGVKPSGVFHIGNYVSTIKPIIDSGLQEDTLFLIADYHALTSHTKKIYSNKLNIAKILYSFGIENIVFQSDFPQVCELQWILSNFTAKGLMNRAHAYKAIMDDNIENGKDQDKNVNMGLYNYPVLITSDLCLFGDEKVFIGQDQIQHIEMAKEIVNKFNHYVKSDVLNVPEPVFKKEYMLEGFDGRKMSKSYDNIIPVMCSEKKLRKHIYSMKTNSKNVGEPKYWDESPVCKLYEMFVDSEKCELLSEDMREGMSWGEVKEIVFDKVNDEFAVARDIYNELDDAFIYRITQEVGNNIVYPELNEKLYEIKRLLCV